MQEQNKFESEFFFGDKVAIDGEKSGVKGIVTGFSFRRNKYTTIEVSWIANGTNQVCWIEDWRLTKVT